MRMGADEKSYPLSVIIPIHRSDLDIKRCLRSLLNNPCLDLQIIIAANSDRRSELQRINRLIPNYPCITLLNIHKAGKANVINEALRYVRNEYVLIGDADTLFVSEGINQCMRKVYADDTIVAITGVVDPIETNALTSIQKFEYRRAFRIFRPFWNLFHANLIISGCSGIFKTGSLQKVGAYDCHTLGEDFEITLRLHDYNIQHKTPYKIDYVDALVAKTDVPQTFRALIRQRGRWFAGQTDVVWKYRHFLLHPIMYKKIIIPYLLMILFEILTTYLKWVLYGVGIVWGIVTGSSIIKILLITGLCFIAFESLFNLCAGKRIGVKGIATIVCVTCALIMIQFVLKDTNMIAAIRQRMRKENKWE